MNSIQKDSDDMQVSEWKSPQLIDEASASKSDKDLRQEIYEEAFKEGYDNGMETGKREAREQLQIIQNLLAALSKPFNEQGQQLVESIAQLSGKIAKSVVSMELRTDPEMFKAMVSETISALNTNQQNVIIHLNPQSAKVIREMMSDDANGEYWRIVDDASVSLDDCKVFCQDSIIDVSLDDRINLIIQQLLENDSNETRE